MLESPQSEDPGTMGVIFGIVWFVLLLQSCANTSNRHPYGPRMCDGLCSHVAGCQAYVYFPGNLSCYTTQLSRFTEKRTLFRNISLDIYKKAKACKRDARVFKTRNNLYQCQISMDNKQTRKKLCFLITKKTETVRDIPCYFPHDNSWQRQLRVPKLPIETLLAISNKKLLIYTRHRLLSTPLDIYNASIAVKRIEIKDMVKDEMQNVFILGQKVSHGPFFIWKMTKHQRDVKVAFQLTGKRCSHFVCSSKRQTFVINCEPILSVYNWTGHEDHTIVTDEQRVHALALDIERDLLYYATPSDVVKYSLTERSNLYSTRIYYARSLIYFEDRVYVLTMHRKFFVLSVKEKEFDALSEVSFSVEGMPSLIMTILYP